MARHMWRAWCVPVATAILLLIGGPAVAGDVHATPESVVDGYFIALNQKDVALLRQLYTDETVRLGLEHREGEAVPPEGVTWNFEQRQKARMNRIPKGVCLTYSIRRSLRLTLDTNRHVIAVDIIPADTALGHGAGFFLHRVGTDWRIDFASFTKALRTVISGLGKFRMGGSLPDEMLPTESSPSPAPAPSPAPPGQ